MSKDSFALPLHRLFPQISPEQVLAECGRELTQRRNFYPRRIDEAKMTQAEADAQLALAAAWHQDIQRIVNFETRSRRSWNDFKETDGAPGIVLDEIEPPTHTLRWDQRRQGLGRELGMRHRIYPRRIEAAQMTQQEADHRIACLEALAARYDDGFDWRASNGERTHFGSTVFPVPPHIVQARTEWAEHRERVEELRTPPQQKELTL